ncbi:hypothetical protein [Nocardioides rubriscoriae]|uniref:hypothetical protein n=1 Tax=Nocardioides rubriscoriae TaxID=642762 RepID=UPI0011E01329|nr:hypothetical protein [Nocardioides rubriscoriae]
MIARPRRARSTTGRSAVLVVLAVLVACAVVAAGITSTARPHDRSAVATDAAGPADPAGPVDPAARDARAAGGTLVVSSPDDPAVRLSTRPPQQSVPLLTLVEPVTVDPATSGQTWTGVGAALTDSAVAHLEDRPDLVRLLLDPAAAQGARLQWLRLPLSATDFSTQTWGWRVRDGRVVPGPQARRTLRFLREQVLPIDRGVRLVATPWSAPPRFKVRRTWFGSSLRDDAVASYADFLVGQVRWLREHRFPVRALTLANEPGLAERYPTMLVSDAQLSRLARLVGPRVDALGVDLWALDHNWSDVARARTALRDAPGAHAAVAFHCYAGVPAQAAGLEVPWLVDECTGTDDSAVGTLDWDSRVLVDQSVDAGSTGLLMFNLALSPGERGAFGGCGTCRGLLTVDGDASYAEPELYVLAHLSRAARRGSTVVGVSGPLDVVSAGFRRRDGSVGVYGYNRSDRDRYLRLQVDGTDGRVFRIGPHEVFTWSSGTG